MAIEYMSGTIGATCMVLAKHFPSCETLLLKTQNTACTTERANTDLVPRYTCKHSLSRPVDGVPSACDHINNATLGVQGCTPADSLHSAKQTVYTLLAWCAE